MGISCLAGGRGVGDRSMMAGASAGRRCPARLRRGLSLAWSRESDGFGDVRRREAQPGRSRESPFGNGSGVFDVLVIQAADVDSTEPWPDGRYGEEDAPLSDRPDGRGMVASRTVAAEAGRDRASATDRASRGAERDPVPCPHRLWLADAAGELSTMADGVLVVPALRPAVPVPHDPRHRADDRPGAGRARRQPLRRHPRQPDGQGPPHLALSAASMAPTRSWAASGTSPSTPMVAC